MSKEREIKIKDAYLQKIIDVGCYDENTIDISHLKNIIDELVSLAEKGLDNDDKSPYYATFKDLLCCKERMRFVFALWRIKTVR